MTLLWPSFWAFLSASKRPLLLFRKVNEIFLQNMDIKILKLRIKCTWLNLCGVFLTLWITLIAQLKFNNCFCSSIVQLVFLDIVSKNIVRVVFWARTQIFLPPHFELSSPVEFNYLCQYYLSLNCLTGPIKTRIAQTRTWNTCLKFWNGFIHREGE